MNLKEALSRNLQTSETLSVRWPEWLPYLRILCRSHDEVRVGHTTRSLRFLPSFLAPFGRVFLAFQTAWDGCKKKPWSAPIDGRWWWRWWPGWTSTRFGIPSSWNHSTDTEGCKPFTEVRGSFLCSRLFSSSSSSFLGFHQKQRHSRRQKEGKSCFQIPLFGSLDSRRERAGGGGGGRATRAPALLGSSYWDLLVALRSLPYWILKAFVLSLLVTIWSFSFLLYWVAFWVTKLLSCLAAVASLLQQFFLTQLRKSKLLVRCCFVGLACSLGAYVCKLHWEGAVRKYSGTLSGFPSFAFHTSSSSSLSPSFVLVLPSKIRHHLSIFLFWGSCGEYKSLCFLLACLSFCSAVEIVIAKEVMDIIVASWHGALYFFFISFVVDSPAFRSLGRGKESWQSSSSLWFVMMMKKKVMDDGLTHSLWSTLFVMKKVWWWWSAHFPCEKLSLWWRCDWWCSFSLQFLQLCSSNNFYSIGLYLKNHKHIVSLHLVVIV